MQRCFGKQKMSGENKKIKKNKKRRIHVALFWKTEKVRKTQKIKTDG